MPKPAIAKKEVVPGSKASEDSVQAESIKKQLRHFQLHEHFSISPTMHKSGWMLVLLGLLLGGVPWSSPIASITTTTTTTALLLSNKPNKLANPGRAEHEDGGCPSPPSLPFAHCLLLTVLTRITPTRPHRGVQRVPRQLPPHAPAKVPHCRDHEPA